MLSTPVPPARRVPGNAGNNAILHGQLLEASENPAIQIFDPMSSSVFPFAPTPFRVTFHVKAGETEITRRYRLNSAT